MDARLAVRPRKPVWPELLLLHKLLFCETQHARRINAINFFKFLLHSLRHATPVFTSVTLDLMGGMLGLKTV